MQPYNPYVPPAAVPVAAQAPRAYRSRAAGIKWLYLPAALLRFGAQLGVHFAEADQLLKAFASLAYAGLVFVLLGLAGAWIYTAWGDVPPDDRAGTSPEGAVGKLFIPFYNLYWIFAVATGLCGILNNELERRGASLRAPTGLAIFGCLTYFASAIFGLPGLELAGAFVSLLSAGVWFTYMFQCDKARTVLAQGVAAP